MSSERMWLITMAIGFSALLITTYFVMTPPFAFGQKGWFITDSGLLNAIDKVRNLKNEEQNPDDLNSGK